MVDDEEFETFAPNRQFQALDLVICLVGFFRGTASVVAEQFGLLETALCGHANYVNEQRRFAREASQSIESITEAKE